MPSRHVLSPSQREGLLDLPADLPADAIRRFYTLGPETMAAVRQRRGTHNRLGFALQWAYLRYPGRPWEPGELPPEEVLALR